jgi:hypothetical protein
MLEGKKSAMNREKIKSLDSIGFFWMAKQKDGGAPAIGTNYGTGAAGAGGAAGLLGMMNMGGSHEEEKNEGYGEEADEGSDDDDDVADD